MTDLHRNSKADTRFLGLKGDGGVADMAVDISQERTDLTDNSTFLRESSSARTAITTPREISLLFTAKTGDSGILLNHGTNDGASSTFRVDVAGGILRCLENGTVRVEVALPALSGSDREFIAQWSTRPEGSQVRSELIIINDTIGTLAFGFATHAVGTTSSSWNLQVGGYGNGPTSAYDVDDISGVRIGKRFHSMTEAVEDFRVGSTKPALLGTVRDAVLPINPDLGLEGQFAGPAYLLAGAAARDDDRRLHSPLVNVRAPAEFSITRADHTGANRRFYRAAPGDPGFYLAAQHWHCVPVPPNVNKARVRIFVRMHTTGDGPCDLIFAAHSWANFPFVGDAVKPQVIYRTGNTILNEDHASGGGEWLDLGDVQLARDEFGMTSICIAHSFDYDEDSDAADDTVFAVLAIVVEPYSLPAADPGYDTSP
jgi:hypothetical protein